MRIARLEIRNHPGIGDLDLNFLKADGTIPRLVVLAGENGCGKTAILNAIHTLLDNRPGGINLPASTEVRLFIQTNIRHPAPPYSPAPLQTTQAPPEAHAFIAAHPNFTGFMLSNTIGAILLPQVQALTIPYQMLVGSNSNSFYSRANLSFNVPVVQQANTYGDSGDPAEAGAAPSSQEVLLSDNLGVEIAQLLVNLDYMDNTDLAAWVDAHPGLIVPEDQKHRRIKRFSNAFAKVMPNKRLQRIERSSNSYDAIFDGPGGGTRLADLSTGEKQIVFRGAFLLRKMRDLPGTVVLVDEPELSLHPDWQSKIVAYYDDLVMETPDNPSQIVIATHSPFVVHGSPLAKHIILKRDPSGRVIEDPTPSYAGVTSGAVAIAAFDLSSSVFASQGNKMVVITEGRTDAEILRAAWTHLRSGQPMPFNLMFAGGAKSVRSFLGAEANTSGPLADALSDAQVDRFLALFDFDREGYEQWNGVIKPAHAEAEDLAAACAYRKRRGARVWAALLPVPSFRPAYAGFGAGMDSRSRLTIELLFEDAHIRHYLAEEPIPAVPGATVLVAPDGQKAAIATAVTTTFPAAAFGAFEPIFQLVESILLAP